ncbi:MULTISPECIES: pirin-like C-terminal cupin domain-containing protein [Aeromonas]|uniref:pirin family protein n=1 Tax=Aeromonas TaxID=642 RepID=UPI002B053815|nr:pirin-like C-terminal cupin domain-containing protein [Aeromonas jandaei]
MTRRLTLSDPVKGQPLRIGSGFEAHHFGEHFFNGLIDPVVMVDHFQMTAPTFEPHPHAGISAVTYLFEDSTSPHVNYDSLGNQGPIEPGALHWLAAGRGAVHTEQPEGASPYVHAAAATIPEFHGEGVRVRVVAGHSNGITAPHSAELPQPFTLLDGNSEPGSRFTHLLAAGWNAMIYPLTGSLTFQAEGERHLIPAGHGMAVSLSADGGEAVALQLEATEPCHFVLLSGQALNEPLVKHGPFVMNSHDAIADRLHAYQRGEFGQLNDEWLHYGQSRP